MRHRDAELGPSREMRWVGDADLNSRRLVAWGHIAERMASWAAWGASRGIVYRYPLTDRRVLEHVLSLPPAVRFGDGEARWLARRAFADVLPGGLKKEDHANEKLRHDNRVRWLERLVRDEAAGRFADECPWLDMAALRAAVRRGPTGDRTADAFSFIRIFVALRVHAMHQRLGG